MSSASPPTSRVPSPQQATEQILAGRKCYRMSKDKNEVVWPPHLEAALMKGLSEYAPAESKSPRGLTRFPNRNKFISEYIFNTTGEKRTAKQVGSRIQQLRDTPTGKKIMQAISDRHYEMMHPSRPPPPQDVLGMGMPGMPDMLFSSADMLLPPMTHVYINAPATASPPAFEQGSSRQTSVNVLSADQYQWVEPRPLRRIDPTVSFKSAAAAPLWSTCRVYCESTFLHESAAQAMEVRDDAVEGAYLYFATLAPGYWHTLCAIPDLTPYTIIQDITRPCEDAGARGAPPATVMTIVYHFTPTPAPPLSPFAFPPPPHGAELDVEYDAGSDELLATPPALSSSSGSPYRSDRSISPGYALPLPLPQGFVAPAPAPEWMQAQPAPDAQWAGPALGAQQQQLPPPSFPPPSSFSGPSYFPQQQQGGRPYMGHPSHSAAF